MGFWKLAEEKWLPTPSVSRVSQATSLAHLRSVATELSEQPVRADRWGQDPRAHSPCLKKLVSLTVRCPCQAPLRSLRY